MYYNDMAQFSIYNPILSRKETKKFKPSKFQIESTIPISFPVTKYKNADPDREVIPVQYVPSKKGAKRETPVEDSSPLEWARLRLQSDPEVKQEEVKPVEPKQEEVKKSRGKRYSDKKKFKADLKAAYEKELHARGISTDYADYMVAQDALESGWGTSSLSEHYNFGGVKETRKGKGIQKKTKESYDGKTLTDTIDSFRQFDSLNDYVKYKIDLLGNSNYDVFSYNPDQLYTRLVTAKNKYATDPAYLDKMNKMYKLILAIS